MAGTLRRTIRCPTKPFEQGFGWITRLYVPGRFFLCICRHRGLSPGPIRKKSDLQDLFLTTRAINLDKVLIAISSHHRGTKLDPSPNLHRPRSARDDASWKKYVSPLGFSKYTLQCAALSDSAGCDAGEIGARLSAHRVTMKRQVHRTSRDTMPPQTLTGPCCKLVEQSTPRIPSVP